MTVAANLGQYSAGEAGEGQFFWGNRGAQRNSYILHALLSLVGNLFSLAILFSYYIISKCLKCIVLWTKLIWFSRLMAVFLKKTWTEVELERNFASLSVILWSQLNLTKLKIKEFLKSTFKCEKERCTHKENFLPRSNRFFRVQLKLAFRIRR